MSLDMKAPSPAKGKAKEDPHWHPGWWEFLPLIERTSSPVEWSNSSTIFTPHPTQPLVTARHFSSSKQFTVPSPAPILSSPALFEPPTVISASPNDSWLFAYFPGRGGDGTGCLWQRGPQFDSWSVREWLSFTRGEGVVTASWMGTDREWVTDQSGSCIRLPLRGPPTPVSSPTLLIVTQAHQLKVCYFRAYSPSLKVMTCSLTHPNSVLDNSPIQDVSNGHGGNRACVHAAVGLGYNESAIIVATRSYLYPSPSNTSVSYNGVNLDFTLDIPTHMNPSDIDPIIEWSSWGEESTIELCEVQLTFDGNHMGLSAHPVLPIHRPAPGLTNLAFVCVPPKPSHDSSQSPSSPRKQVTERGQIYLASSYLDFGDYTRVPTSELMLHSISRNMTGSPTNRPQWLTQLRSSHSFSSGVLVFFAPTADSTGIYAAVFDTTGTISQRHSRLNEIPIGSVTVLNIPELNEHGEWENSMIMSSVDKIRNELPLHFVVSPNRALLCTLSSSILAPEISIHLMPKRRRTADPSTGHPVVPPSSHILLGAVLSRKTTSDLAHAISRPHVPIDEIQDTVYHMFSMLQTKHNGLPDQWIWEALGLMIEVYRFRTPQLKKPIDQERFSARSQAAHDMCSLAACNSAFQDCREGDAYDLAAIWQLVGLSTWIINFIEQLVKECVYSCDVSKNEVKEETSDDLFGSVPPSPPLETPLLDSPTFLHIIIPFALTNLHDAVRHVKRFRDRLAGLSARGENTQIARDILLDLVDCSGVDLNALQPVLADLVQTNQVNMDDLLRSLASCEPTPALRLPLQNAIHKISDSADKSRLFVKPVDLVDGVSRITLREDHGKEKDRDVVSKVMLVKRNRALICLRCNGKSEVGREVKHVSLRWRTWEKTWTNRCICGGLWANSSL